MSPVRVSDSMFAYFSASSAFVMVRWKCAGYTSPTVWRRMASFCARTSVTSDGRPGSVVLSVIGLPVVCFGRFHARLDGSFGLFQALAHDGAAQNGHGIKQRQ